MGKATQAMAQWADTFGAIYVWYLGRKPCIVLSGRQLMSPSLASLAICAIRCVLPRLRPPPTHPIFQLSFFADPDRNGKFDETTILLESTGRVIKVKEIISETDSIIVVKK